jgi:hypothetical protein
MLARAGELGAQTDPPATAPAPAPVTSITISAESLPGLCMGVTVLTSLGLARIGWGALTEAEGRQLSDAILKNIIAWNLIDNIADPRIAAGLDLGGAVLAIVVPRMVNELTRRAPAHVPEGIKQEAAP